MIHFDIFQDTPVRAFFSTRLNGVSQGAYQGLNVSFHVGDKREYVAENRDRFLQTCGVQTADLCYAKQVHSNRILNVSHTGYQGEGDGLMTHHADQYLSVTVADCLSVFLYHPHKGLIALLHAGWRGIVNNIISSTLTCFQHNDCDTADLRAAIAPHIQSCCFTVKKDVADYFSSHYKRRLAVDQWSVNLQALVSDQLQQHNVHFIEETTQCTGCESQLFFSYRRDGKQSGRMMALMGIDNTYS